MNFLPVNGARGSIIRASPVENEEPQTILLKPLDDSRVSVKDTCVREESDEGSQSSKTSSKISIISYDTKTRRVQNVSKDSKGITASSMK